MPQPHRRIAAHPERQSRHDNEAYLTACKHVHLSCKSAKRHDNFSSKADGSRVVPCGVKGMQSTPLRIGLQWLQVLPSALLHHQVAGLPELLQPRMRKLLTPLTPLARRSWQKALQSGVLPTYHIL